MVTHGRRLPKNIAVSVAAEEKEKQFCNIHTTASRHLAVNKALLIGDTD